MHQRLRSRAVSVSTALYGLMVATAAHAGTATLEARAILPADTFARGPTSGQFIAPTNGPAWVTSDDPTVGDDFSHFAGSSSAAAISGYADITVPAGYIGPLPLGITFIGGHWDEPELIALAYAFEQLTQVRTPIEKYNG